MNIGIVGGGPAGLYFALLMKKRNPRHRIRVVEQNRADNTYGWGVVFSGRALAFLQAGDEALYADLMREIEIWQDQTIMHKGQSVLIDGMPFSGISRIRLLNVLQQHCLKHGVELVFGQRVDDFSGLDLCDLIVGADGVNSRVRELNAQHFKTERRFCSNYFIWYGTARAFDTLSLIFRSNDDGVFVAHTYRYSPQMSTFLVECDAATWRRAGFTQMSDAESRFYCEAVFCDDLQNNPLQSNKSVWLNFPQIRNALWYHNNIVLIGDALRSVHFSIGSGTRTAMQDAMALAGAFAEAGDDVTAALQKFAEARRPGADKLLQVAEKSMAWYDNFAAAMALEPLPFAMDYMMRGGRVDLDELRERSPRLMAAWDSYRAVYNKGGHK